jgi:hypothetical protein
MFVKNKTTVIGWRIYGPIPEIEVIDFTRFGMKSWCVMDATESVYRLIVYKMVNW